MKKSFTLIELIVVIAIIAILAAIIAPNAFKAIEKAKVARAMADWKAFKGASGSFYADTGQWPGTANTNRRIEDTGLLTDPGTISGWDGPYLEGGTVKHPWGGMYWLSRNVDYQDPGWALWSELAAGETVDLDVEMGNECYFPVGSAVPSGDCSISDSISTQIDSKIDDGNLSTGNVRYFCPDRSCALSCGVDFRWLLQPDSG